MASGSMCIVQRKKQIPHPYTLGAYGLRMRAALSEMTTWGRSEESFRRFGERVIAIDASRWVCSCDIEHRVTYSYLWFLSLKTTMAK